MKSIFIVFILFFSCMLYSQEKMSYNSKKGKIEFSVSNEEYYSKYSDQNFRDLKQQGINFQEVAPNSVIIKGKIDNISTFSRFLKSVRPEKIEPILIYSDGTKQIVDGQINIKTKPNININKLVGKWNFTIQQNKFDITIYLLISSTYTTETIFEIVNELQKNKDVEFVEPNFIRLLSSHTTDPYFSNQWAYKNSQGADIKVTKTWEISKGLGVKIAVLDEGVDLNHPDLNANLLTGYDATGNNSKGSPNYNTDDSHGTACSGIIAAVANNGIGIAGIAYDAKIIPIRIAYSNGLPLGDNRRRWIVTDSNIANGIEWAWKYGSADVLNNSWGGGSYSTLIDTAIKNATNNGRSGKGCIVVFSSGNNNKDYVNFPAYLDNVMAVGAMSMCNERKSPSSCDKENWGAHYGNALDIVAPGVSIYTTDNNGTSGYSLTDYSYFNGTSSSAPHVAGVAALILSANPNLTGKEVRDIIEKTAQKVGGYNYQKQNNRPNGTWNNEMGYGLVDAYKAVQYATIGGVDSSCPNVNNTFELKVGLPVGATIKWESPQGMQTISGQGTKKCTLNALSAGNYLIKVIVTHNGTHKTYEKELKVFQPYSMPPPTIKNHPNTPSSIPCCGGSNYIKHVICTSSGELEWQNTITYKDPKDYVTFIVKSNEVEMQVTRFTSTPLIVSTKAREVASKGNPCSKTSDWSETISRYYGSVRHKSFGFYPNKTTSKKRAITEKNYFIDEYFLSKDLLNIEVTDIYEWLDMTYSNKNLTENDVEKIMYIINNEDLLKQLNIKIFNLDGKLIFNKDYNSENIIEINVSHLQKGNYVIYYSCGSLSHGKVIYKPL